ncbi:concanavalin A-like lectin/glucanase domain-containing protein [Schizothecium vesticola]|uniref:Concanavalin A-like lectin/glucanase domain-containing protein n=1 Tax=Schizothecium vesticola TaxID=314040 RepID=A0AA40ENI4_9PEZI|nr:concanavalin A-like lectin/glucanase domain-containing protein [Schizothecium vesticola]
MPSHPGLTLLAAVASLITTTYGAFPLTSDSNCGCYKTNATKSNYFGHHKFWDFRSLHEHAKVPPPLDTFEGNERADATSPFFGGGQAWAATWAMQNWNNTELLQLKNTYVNDATIKMVNSFNNIYIESSHNETAGQAHNATGPWLNGTAPWLNGTASPGLTFMTMRTVRHDNFQSSAEFESRSAGYQFLSIRMYARTKGARGAVTAMFTYRAPPTPHNMALVQEADLEIRTNDPPTYVSYTNQPAWNSTGDIPEATRNVSLPSGRRWSDWAHYRMDWTPGSTTWFVNGQQHSSISFQAPRDPAHVMFNSWSDGGSWSGHMRPREEAYLQIQWIEIVYNNTDTGRERPGKCVNVCSIDETTELGTPVLITGDSQSQQPVSQPPFPQQPRPSTTLGRPPTSQGRPPTSRTSQTRTTSTQSKTSTTKSTTSQTKTTSQSRSQTSSTLRPTAGVGGCTSKKYDQCDGKNWAGCKVCVSGTTCKFQNDYYSQCV